jgi:hypothetical protein
VQRKLIGENISPTIHARQQPDGAAICNADRQNAGGSGALSRVELIAFLIVFGLDFAVGYGVREQKSRMRRRRHTRDLSGR